MKTTRSARPTEAHSSGAPARSFLARHAALAPLLLIILVGAAVWANSLPGVFLFDDVAGIVSNPALRHFPTLARAMADPRPVVFVTFALNYLCSAYNPWSYHLVNIAVHLLAALALFGIVRRTLLHCRLPMADGRMITDKGESKANVARRESVAVQSAAISQHSAIGNRQSAIACRLALATALIWEVHPLQTESVTYVIQRAESLMALFYLLALYCLIRSDGSPRPYRWHAAAVASCLLGAGCKEVIVTLPVVALAYDALFLTGSWRRSLRRRWGLYLGLALCCGLAVVRFVLRAPEAAPSVGFGMKEATLRRYLLTEPGVVLCYLRLSFWPRPLCLDYGWRLVGSLRDALPALAAIGVLAAVSLAGLVRGRRWGFLGLAFFCILAPTSSFVPVKDPAFEHRMYLPLAAVISAAVLAVWWRCNRAWPRAAGRGSGRALAAAAILAVAGLSLLTVRRNALYHDEIALWRQTVRSAPGNARAHMNLGTALGHSADSASRPGDAARRREESILELDRAIEINPNVAKEWYNRSCVYAKGGRNEEAERDLNRTLALDPDFAEAYVNRGNLLAAAGHVAESISDYDRAIKLNPDIADAWFNRGTACARLGQAEAALRDLDRAIELKPNDADEHYNRGNLCLDAKRYDAAIGDYSQAIELKPDYADAWYNRANAYAASDRPAEADRDYSQAIELRPADPDAYYNRSIVRSRMKQDGAALADLQMARKLRATAPETSH